MTDVATLFQHTSTMNPRWVFAGYENYLRGTINSLGPIKELLYRLKNENDSQNKNIKVLQEDIQILKHDNNSPKKLVAVN